MAPLLAKPSPLNINLGSDRFSMFNKKAGHRHGVLDSRFTLLCGGFGCLLRSRSVQSCALHEDTPTPVGRANMGGVQYRYV